MIFIIESCAFCANIPGSFRGFSATIIIKEMLMRYFRLVAPATAFYEVIMVIYLIALNIHLSRY